MSNTEALPPLPEPYHGFYAAPMFTADQMRAYARQALAQPAASGEPAQIRADFEQRMIGVGASPTALSRLKSGEYLSPSIQSAWKAEILADLKRAAAAKWRGDPAAQQWGLFARAAAEIETLRDALVAAHRMWNEQAAQDALTAEQVAALTIMLDHYHGDPRADCLRPLVYGPNVRAKRETPMTKPEDTTQAAGGSPLELGVSPAVGDYVLATKYSDGDPGDNWALGFYAGPMLEYTPPRHDVVDSDGKSIRGNGFRYVRRIRKDVGRWLLTVAAKQLEQSPPGTVNLWTMLTPAAFEVIDEQG